LIDPHGNRIIDDLTCGRVYFIIQYVRDKLHVPVKDMVFKATRINMKVLNVRALPMVNHTTTSAAEGFYKLLIRAVTSKFALVEKFLALFEFFNPLLFMHDNNRGQYFSVISATPLPGMLFEAKYEEIGEDMPLHQPPKEPECGLPEKCVTEMKKVCTMGGGLGCKVCVDVKYPYLALGHGCPLLDIVENMLFAKQCFCGKLDPPPPAPPVETLV